MSNAIYSSKGEPVGLFAMVADAPRSTRSLADARAAKDAGIAKAERGMDADWFNKAVLAVHRVAQTHREFTSDDVRVQLQQYGVGEPREPRAFGPLMKAAEKDGVCEASDQWRQGTNPTSHSRPMRVWKSLVYRGSN